MRHSHQASGVGAHGWSRSTATSIAVLTFIILMGSSLIPVVNEYGMEEETGTSTGAGITGGEAGTREGEVGETPGADADPVIPGDALPIPRSDCSLTPLVHSSPALPPEATVTRGRVQGSKEMILLGCNYSDLDPKGQHDAAFMEQRSLDMSDYYQETSYGMVSLNGTWGGWHAVPQTRAYYGADSVDKNDVNVNSLITHAVGVADPYVDFSKFDANSDGYIDYLIVVHAGGDQAITGDSDDIWSHRGYNIQTPLVDGVRVGYYVIVAEDDALGVYVHEFGHFFGLPDLYDTDYTSDGIGIWGLMAAGPHLDNGDTPAHFCAWSKAFLGWVEPIEVTENLIDHIIVPVETNQVVYRLSVSTKEYFLIENRQRVGYDAYLPGDGLLIWHIDDSVGSLEWNDVQNSEGHKRVDLEENGPTQHLDKGYTQGDYNQGDSSDLWVLEPAGFNSQSNPDSDSYSGAMTENAVEDITPGSGRDMVADLIVIGRSISMELAGGSTGVKHINPGEYIDFGFDITSNRDGGDAVHLTANGTNAEWVSFPDGPAQLADETDEATVRARITAPANSIPNERCIVDIGAYSSDNTWSTTVHLEVIVNEYHAVGFNNTNLISLDPNSFERVPVIVENHGNVEDKFQLTFAIGPGWTVEGAKSSVDVPAFGKKSVDMQIFSPEEADAGSYATATITATPTGDGSANKTYVDAVINHVYGVAAENITDTSGSGPGGSVVHTVRVTNTGNGDDTYTLTAFGVPGHLNVTMEEDEVKVKAYNHIDVEVTARISKDALADDEGAMFGVGCLSSDGLSEAIVYLIVTVEPEYGMEVEMGTADELEFLPGASAAFTVNVTNTGNIDDVFTFELDRHSGNIIVALDPEDMELEAGSTGEVRLTVTAGDGAPAGSYDLELEVRSKDGSDKEDVELEATIGVVHSAGVTLEPSGADTPRAKPGDQLTFEVTVDNNGNDEETIMLKVTDILGASGEFDGGGGLTLRQGRTGKVDLVIKVADGASLGKVEAYVYGVLEDDSETERVRLAYTVVESGADTSDGGDGDPTTDGNTSDKGGDGGVSLLAIGALAGVGALIAVLVIVLLVKKKKKGESSAAKMWGKDGEGGRVPAPKGEGPLRKHYPYEDEAAGGADVGAGSGGGVVAGTGPVSGTGAAGSVTVPPGGAAAVPPGGAAAVPPGGAAAVPPGGAAAIPSGGAPIELGGGGAAKQVTGSPGTPPLGAADTPRLPPGDRPGV